LHQFNQFYRPIIPGLLALTLACLMGCKARMAKHEWWAMNTNLSLALYGSIPVEPDSVFLLVEQETQRLADIFTNFSDRSELSQVTGKNGDTLDIHPEVEAVLASALEMQKASQGLFDFTLHDLKFLWALGDGQPGRIPSQAELDSLLAGNPRYHSPDSAAGWAPPLVLLGSHKAVILRNQTRLDLGGIAKGYIVDRLHRLLDSLGCSVHLIQAGGEIRVGGSKDGGKPWIIGIRHPRNADSLCGRIQTGHPISVSTSGDYERFFEKDGARYHHIFDPRTGKPSNTSIAVTVIADSSRQTDALTKPLFILGPGAGAALARQFGASAIWFHETPEGICASAMPEAKEMLSLQGVKPCPKPGLSN
jgi:FAD:protein FMN transferase